MNKIRCPTCRQNVLVDATWVGRRMTCPSCETRFIIPAAGGEPTVVAPVAIPRRPSRSGPARSPIRVPLSAKARKSAASLEVKNLGTNPAKPKTGKSRHRG